MSVRCPDVIVHETIHAGNAQILGVGSSWIQVVPSYSTCTRNNELQLLGLLHLCLCAGNWVNAASLRSDIAGHVAQHQRGEVRIFIHRRHSPVLSTGSLLKTSVIVMMCAAHMLSAEDRATCLIARLLEGHQSVTPVLVQV